jgi:hypothetical protein
LVGVCLANENEKPGRLEIAAAAGVVVVVDVVAVAAVATAARGDIASLVKLGAQLGGVREARRCTRSRTSARGLARHRAHERANLVEQRAQQALLAAGGGGRRPGRRT